MKPEQRQQYQKALKKAVDAFEPIIRDAVLKERYGIVGVTVHLQNGKFNHVKTSEEFIEKDCES